MPILTVEMLTLRTRPAHEACRAEHVGRFARLALIQLAHNVARAFVLGRLGRR